MKMLIATGEAPLRSKGLTFIPLNYVAGKPCKFGSVPQVTVLFLKPRNSLDEFCLITIDSIWIGDGLSDKIRTILAQSLNIEVENISIVASHSHGTPNNDARFHFNFCGNEYLESLETVILNLTVKTYLKRRELVSTKVFLTETEGVSINRRRLALIPKLFWPTIRTQNLPNASKKINKSIISIHFYTRKSLLRAMIFNFACHPVCDPSNHFGADFPGALREKFREKHGKNFSFHFIQGFCGDIRPALFLKPVTLKDYILNILIGNRFRASQTGDTEAIATKILDFYSRRKEIKFSNHAHTKVWAKNQKIPVILEKGNSLGRKIDVTRWVFGNLNFTFLSAEVLSRYSIQSQYLKKNVVEIEAGYSNGMLGYLPTKEDFLGGGYEIDASRKKFAIPSRISKKFAVSIQKILFEMAQQKH